MGMLCAQVRCFAFQWRQNVCVDTFPSLAEVGFLSGITVEIMAGTVFGAVALAEGEIGA